MRSRMQPFTSQVTIITSKKAGVESCLSFKPRTHGQVSVIFMHQTPGHFSSRPCSVLFKSEPVVTLEYHAPLFSLALRFYHQFLHPVSFLEVPPASPRGQR